MSFLGLVLLYVGAVLFINGLSMIGQVSKREAVIMNIFTGLVSLSVAAYNAFAIADIQSVKNAAFGLLFGFTYLWVAYNNATDADGRGLGWFSLFVAITAIPIFLLSINAAQNIGEEWLAFNWAAWSVLWFSFFLLNVVNKTKSYTRPIGWFTIVQSIITAWIPGFLLLTGYMPGIN